MTSAAATTLDLSRLPAPDAISAPAFEAMLEARLADLKTRLPAFDAMVESDPAVKLQEADAYRELLALARINDAVRAQMLAFASGSDLDHLAALYAIERHVVTPAAPGTPAVLETDEAFRRRVLLAPEAFAAAGPQGAYVFHALSADARVLNADVWSPSPGQVIVAVQSREADGTASEELVEAVRGHLARPDIKPLTDILSVRSVANVPYAIEAECFVLPGPAPALVRQEIVAAIEAMAAARRTPARDVPRSAIFAAASIPAVDKAIIASPAVDIARDHGEVGICTSVDVTVTVYDG